MYSQGGAKLVYVAAILSVTIDIGPGNCKPRCAYGFNRSAAEGQSSSSFSGTFNGVGKNATVALNRFKRNLLPPEAELSAQFTLKKLYDYLNRLTKTGLESKLLPSGLIRRGASRATTFCIDCLDESRERTGSGYETKEGAAAGNARIRGAQSLLRLLGLNPVHVRGRDRQGDERTCTVQLRAGMGSFDYRLVSSMLGVLLNCSSCAPRNVAQHPGIVLNTFSNFSSCLAATLNTDFNLVGPTVGWNNHQAATSNEVRPVALSQLTLRRRPSRTPPNAVKIQSPQLAHEPTHNHSPRGARAFGLRLVVYPAKSQSNSPSQVTNSRVLELATFCCFNQDSSELQSPLKLPTSAILVKSAPQLSPSTLTAFNTLQINKSSSNQVRNASSET
ncbi:hypothetical protein B0H16DRAFT_1696529 [Mycena metata]|uniref:Uncharacterized protein n=1 Tax=Mycena metata TaxID=1033252 RepID=A0AAD7I004_9AGAR|nr:hypothetical protein B0H16DRAFT_1696529 [Mycena metata]